MKRKRKVQEQVQPAPAHGYCLLLVPLCLAAVIAVGAYGMRAMSRPSAVRESPDRYRVVLGWDVADIMIDRRAQYLEAIGREGLPEWDEYTTSYFRGLAARRRAVIQWATAEANRPRILHLGLIHVNVAGGNTPERVAEINAIQTRIFDRLREESAGAGVIAIENSGSDAVMTEEAYAQVTQDMLLNLYGMRVTDSEVRDLMRQDAQAATRAVHELSVPVICGEEWPLTFETRLLARGASGNASRDQAARELIGALNRLRSETILIRALEYLRRSGGNFGIILQGDHHRSDFEDLEGTYHIAFRGVPPT